MTTAHPTQGPLRLVDGTMPALQERVQDIPVVGFIDYCLRGIGQVVFMNSPLTGLFIMVAGLPRTRGNTAASSLTLPFSATRHKSSVAASGK